MIIGLCGAAGSGKNAVAGVLSILYGFKSLALADPLYDAVAVITGLTVKELQDRRLKEQPIDWIGKSPRQLLQSLGTEWGRGLVSESLWVDHLFRRLDCLTAAGVNAVVTDVRFDNEARLLRDRYNARIWQVIRPTGTVAGAAMQHASEAGISQELIDVTIGNSSGLAYLRQIVEVAAASELAMQRRQKATIKE